jgi:hypothetical protein
MQGSVDLLIAFHAEHGLLPYPSRAVAEIALHQSRTAVVALPMSVRSASKQWLIERGYRSLDDGDVPPTSSSAAQREAE